MNVAAPEEWCRSAQRYRQAPAHKGPNSGTVVGHRSQRKLVKMGCTPICKDWQVDPQEIWTAFRCSPTFVNVYQSWARSTHTNTRVGTQESSARKSKDQFGRNEFLAPWTKSNGKHWKPQGNLSDLDD